MEFLRQLIINAHFGNARNPRITVLTTDGEWEELFKRQYNSIPLVADVVFVKMCQARIDYALVESLGNLGALEAAVFSTSQDGETLEMAEAFSQLTASSGEKQRAAAGNVSAKSLYACLLPSSSLSELLDRMPLRATVVNVAELGCSYGLLDAEFDREARTLHDKYVADQQKKVEVKRSPLASLSWEELPEFYRDSNRSAALHHRIKRGALKMIGEQGKMDLRERLSKAEHDRWMAERIMSGWRHNPQRNDLAHLHPDIVPYEQLSEETKEYDRNNVDMAWNMSV